MAFAIHDKVGNPYMDINPNKQTFYISLKCASEVLKGCPKGYHIKDTKTKKKVEPI